MIDVVLKEMESQGIDVEVIQVGGKDLHGCRACGTCGRTKDMKCVLDDDMVNECVGKMANADAIIIGSPTYFSDLTAEAKALIDRSGYVLRANGNPLRRKAGAAVVVARRAGATHTFDSINHFFTINEMMVVGSSYWNLSLSRDIGDFEKDAEGIRTMKTLGDNMAWLMKRIGE